MFNVGPEKLMVVLLVALIVLGPDKLPNAARQIGRYLSDFRRISQGFQQELRSAIDMAADPVTTLTQPTPGDSGSAAQPATPVHPDPDVDSGEVAEATDADPTSPPDSLESVPAADEATPVVAPAAEPEPADQPVAMPIPEPAAEPVAEPNHTASA
jgi:sec-independent protein translocase protein TatB